MSIFTELMGEDVNTIRASVGARDAYSSDSRTAQTVRYVQLDVDKMRKIRLFYKHIETEVHSINNRKNGYTLSGGVSFSFIDEKLDGSRFPIVDPLVEMMKEAREWYDMYGFVAVYNPNALLDRKLNQTEDSTDGGLLDTSKALVDEAERLLKRIVPTRADEIVDTLGLETAADIVPGKEDAIVQSLPRITTLEEPGAILNVRKRTADTMSTADTDEDALISEDASIPKAANVRSGRTLDDTLIDLANLRIMSLEDGLFYLEIDQLTLMRRVVFVRQSESMNTLYGARQGPSEVIPIDPTVYVHVWPGMMPEQDGRLMTMFDEVLRLYERVCEIDRNMASVDYQLSNPIIMYEQEYPKYIMDTDALTDAQLFGGPSSKATSNPLEEQAQRKRLENEILLRAQADMLNGRAQNALQQAVAAGRLTKTLSDGKGGTSAIDGRKQPDFELLPPGVHAVNVKPQLAVVTDSAMERFRYRTTLANALNIPLALLDNSGVFAGTRSASKTTGIGSSVTTTATEAGNMATDRLLSQMVQFDRNILTQFINMLWDVMYRDIDNETLEELLRRAVSRTRRQSEDRLAQLRNVSERIDTVVDVTERSLLMSDAADSVHTIAALNARLREIDATVRSALSMQYRFQVQFENLSYLDIGTLQAMLDRGAIQRIEFVNAMRIGIGLLPLSDAEVQKNLNEKIEQQMVEAMEKAKIADKYKLMSNAQQTK